MKPRFIGLCRGVFLSLWLVANLPLIAEENNQPKISDLVPADLKDWTIVYYVRCHREGSTRVWINSDGTVQGNGFRKPPMTVKLSSAEVDVVFRNTRELFNRYRVLKDIDLGGDSDVDLFISIRQSDSRVLELHLDTSRIHRLEVSEFVPKAAHILEHHGYSGFHLYKDEWPTAKQTDNRLPVEATDWQLLLSSNPIDKTSHEIGVRTILYIHNDKISLDWHQDSPGITATSKDRELQQALARKILHEFRWRTATKPKSDVQQKFFSIKFSTDASLTLTCDRQTLIDVGILDELDAWVKDINRRFEAQGMKERFNPPWLE